MKQSKEKLYLKVPSSIVRNDDFYLSNDEFMLYSLLCYFYFRKYGQKEIILNIRYVKEFFGIKDNRVLKNRLNKLNDHNLIENRISIIPRRNEMPIIFNDNLYNSYDVFTLISTEVFELYEAGKINQHAFRLITYYKSHINKSMNNNYCFVGYDTLVTKLKASKTTILEANKMLKNEKLIKVVKHKLEPTYEYSSLDKLIYNKYNNHYYVAERLH